MSQAYSFPRDTGDDEPQRERGRAVPRIVESEPSPLLIDIRVNGVTFGSIDPLQLKARAQMDLERVRGAYDLLAWCEKHAGISGQRGPNGEPSELDQLETELGEMNIGAIVELAQSISAAIGEAVALPKARGRR